MGGGGAAAGSGSGRGICKCSSSKCLFLLPLITCMAFPVTFAATYGYSLYNRNVNSTSTGDFPYISETGATRPESCIFGQLLNIAAVISGLTVYIRYRQAKQALDHFIPSTHAYRVNYVALIIGMLAAFGVSVVGNFQMDKMDNIMIVHYIGAFLAFAVGAVYAWLQCFVSYKLLTLMCTRPIFYFRIACSFLVTTFLVGTLIGAQLYGMNPENKSFRLLSTVSEWIMALSLAMIFASFASEFRATKIEKPRISFIQTKLERFHDQSV